MGGDLNYEREGGNRESHLENLCNFHYCHRARISWIQQNSFIGCCQKNLAQAGKSKNLAASCWVEVRPMLLLLSLLLLLVMPTAVAELQHVHMHLHVHLDQRSQAQLHLHIHIRKCVFHLLYRILSQCTLEAVSPRIPFGPRAFQAFQGKWLPSGLAWVPSKSASWSLQVSKSQKICA